jgi:precorrin-6A synthase
MLDGATAFETLDPAGIQIWWGAYLGMEHEILDSGPLAQTGPRIMAKRKEARARHGWIMDTYILKRQQPTR